jgi:hypothetical protein
MSKEKIMEEKSRQQLAPLLELLAVGLGQVRVQKLELQ